jgi:hypothetical protein
MKEILLLSTLFFSLGTHAQTDTTIVDTSRIKFIEPPDSTGFGTPDGKLANKQIGATGGTIISDDGRVTLIFPAGALTENTTISIQPITNLAPNGAGKAYDFEPSGIQFKKPVQIIFNYTDDEAETCPPELMGLAMQDRAGKWSFINYEDWDSTAKTLKGIIHHFTVYSNVNNLQLYPDRVLLPAGKSTAIFVLDLAWRYTEPPPYGPDFLPALFNGEPLFWYVNGIKNGTSSVGHIQSFDVPLFGKIYEVLARYYAPQYLLPKPVTIRLDVYVYSRKFKGYRRKRQLTCKIEIYDSYEIEVKGEFTVRTEMNSEISDHATLLAVLYAKELYIEKIKNYEPVVIREGKKGPFKEDLSVKGALGSINLIQGVKNYSLSKDYPPEVSFEFPSVEILWCQSRYSARGIKGDWQSVTGKSIPGEIQFIANGEEQKILKKIEGGVYVITIKPFRE